MFSHWRGSSQGQCQLWAVHAGFVESFTESPERNKDLPNSNPLDEVRRCWVTFRFSDYGFSCVLGLAIPPVLSQFPICKMGLTVFPSLTRNRPLLRYYPKL